MSASVGLLMGWLCLGATGRSSSPQTQVPQLASETATQRLKLLYKPVTIIPGCPNPSLHARPHKHHSPTSTLTIRVLYPYTPKSITHLRIQYSAYPKCTHASAAAWMCVYDVVRPLTGPTWHVLC